MDFAAHAGRSMFATAHEAHYLPKAGYHCSADYIFMTAAAPFTYGGGIVGNIANNIVYKTFL
jgi:hypothetical protein